MAKTYRLTIEQVCDALERSRGLITIAARMLGVDSSTVYRYIYRHEKCRQVLEEQRERLIDSAEARIIEAIEQKAEPWAITFVLSRLGKNRGYAERQEITGANGQPVKHDVSLDIAEARKILKLLGED